MSGDAGEEGLRTPDARMIPEWRPPARRTAAGGHVVPDGAGALAGDAAGDAGTDPPPEGSDAVRPFVVTGGRTRPAMTGLRVETLLQRAPRAEALGLRFEARQITDLCAQPLSLAEVGAALGIPFGVARVLVSDLVHLGALAVVRAPEELSIETVERIRDRVRAL